MRCNWHPVVFPPHAVDNKTWPRVLCECTLVAADSRAEHTGGAYDAFRHVDSWILARE